jgi:hypothetical protein
LINQPHKPTANQKQSEITVFIYDKSYKLFPDLLMKCNLTPNLGFSAVYATQRRMREDWQNRSITA